jgi:N-acyl-D-aspartate/D-glutamate deacylase
MQPMLNFMTDELYAGGLGFGIPVGYTTGATREEIFNVYELAANKKVPVFTHVREGGALAVQQAIADASVNGTSLHIVHLNSMTLSEIGLALRMVDHAQQRGFDITTELYPYTAASTFIESAMFNDGWQERLGMTYKDLQLASTGERLTAETFKTNREKGGIVIMHFMKEEWIQEGLKSPVTLVASDGMPYSRFAHPRSAGTFSRVLGHYVREQKLMTLKEGLRKMTLMPAVRMEGVSPMMRFKGRIQVGADADITVFDPNTIVDKATFEEGLKMSEGVKYVLVNGTFVVKNGSTVGNVFPGQAVYGKYKR